MPVDGGTMVNADEKLILAVFHYDELHNSRSPHYSNTNRRTLGCARSPTPQAHQAVLPGALCQGVFEAAAPLVTHVGVIAPKQCSHYCVCRAPISNKRMTLRCAFYLRFFWSHEVSVRWLARLGHVKQNQVTHWLIPLPPVTQITSFWESTL